MVRLFFRTVVALLANAIGLIVAAIVLDGVHINVTSFIFAVIIFTIVFALLQPFLTVQLRRSAPMALGGVALIATLVSLIITDIVSDGFGISGLGNWFAATFIVWVTAVLAAFILPFLGLKKFLEERRD